MYNKRITYFDSLKGIAILAIILAHTGLGPSTNSIVKIIVSFFPRGVQMFFIISALFTYKSLDSYKNNNKNLKT